MKRKYFVTVRGFRVAENLTRKEAVAKSIKELEADKSLSTLNVGIGDVKIIKGKKMYSLLPCHFHFD